MNGFAHERAAAIGVCGACQKAVCRECVGRETPRLVCRNCVATPSIHGYEYRSELTFAGMPVIHVCAGVDPLTMRPKAARGLIAIGPIAIGGVALGGLSCGLFTLGGLSFGLLFAMGGAAIGVGLSIGGLAVGSVAVGGAAIGFAYAIGGGAFGGAIIDGRRCDQEAVEFFRQWLSGALLPTNCR